LDSASITLRGVLGTPVVLAAIAAVVVLQLLFTYLPWFQHTFTTAALSLEQLAFSVVAGVVVLLVLELETAIRNRVKAVRG
ncbi:MAG: cation transporting ATPase C-terminal domain-containing protein, partial [Pseudomonadota bacterium]|nr:cation transporting ATPase C-terminal domain-containing protein [Pseudomonadota bacterium]